MEVVYLLKTTKVILEVLKSEMTPNEIHAFIIVGAIVVVYFGVGLQ